MATRLEIGRRLLLLLLLFLGVQHAGPDGCAARRNFLTSDLVIGRRDCDNRKPQRPKPAPPTRRTGAQSLFPPIPLTVRIRLAAWRDHRQNEKRPGTTPSRSLRWSGWDTMASARSSHSQSLWGSFRFLVVSRKSPASWGAGAGLLNGPAFGRCIGPVAVGDRYGGKTCGLQKGSQKNTPGPTTSSSDGPVASRLAKRSLCLTSKNRTTFFVKRRNFQANLMSTTKTFNANSSGSSANIQPLQADVLITAPPEKNRLGCSALPELKILPRWLATASAD